jgi:hypothetical protein
MLTPIVTESRRLSPHATQRDLVRTGSRQVPPAKSPPLRTRAAAPVAPRPAQS